ncbi:MAG: anion:sodium symporter [Nitrospinae bacterium RIFCSPLOWO2_12_FULL_47_7]|nr:MAG: anion:sodium symporter [Nitrospinae bacterium RIFCSPLOWO2_12_FULL_47_7]
MSTPKEPEQIVIDRRPIWIVIFDYMRRGILLALLFGLFLFFLGREGPADLSKEAYKTLCLFFFCVSLWTTNLIPLSITSLFAIAMIPLLGIMEASKAYAYFCNQAVFFILGVFILSAAMIGCGLSARISIWVLEHWGQSPRSLVTSIYFFGAFGSCLMSEHAVAAMLFPIVMEIALALKLKKQESPLAKSLFFALAWGCIIGGATTVLGGGRAPLGMEILRKSTDGANVLTILQYTQLSLPLILLMLACGWVLLLLLFPPEITDILPAREVLHRKFQALGKVRFQEKGIAAVMIITLVCWFTFGEAGMANIAILSIVALFVFNLTNWKMMDEHVNWAVILMYGGAICLGEVMANTGAALWLAKQVFGGAVYSTPIFLITVAFAGWVLTTFVNDSAAVAMLLPPVLSMSQAYGINPTMAAMIVILSSNFAFILPIGTPASALAYSSRFITLKDMIRSGMLLGFLGILCCIFLLLIYWPLIGVK